MVPIISGVIESAVRTFIGLPAWLQAMLIIAAIDLTIDNLAARKWIPEGKMYYRPLAFKLEAASRTMLPAGREHKDE